MKCKICNDDIDIGYCQSCYNEILSDIEKYLKDFDKIADNLEILTEDAK